MVDVKRWMSQVTDMFVVKVAHCFVWKLMEQTNQFL